MPWTVISQKDGEKRFILSGHGCMLRGMVLRGDMKSDLYWGIRALENGVHRALVTRRYEVRTPRVWGGEANTGKNRRVIQLAPLDPGAEILIRFDQPVPPELLADLRVAFREPDKEQSHEEHPGPVDRQAHHEEGHRQGLDRQRGHRAGHGQDPRLRRDRQGQVAKPAKKKTPIRKKTKAKARS